MIVLQRQNRRRHKQRNLLARLDRLERAAQRHFSLAEADVAAQQTVHRPVGLHIVLDLRDAAQLIVGFLIRERLLELALPCVILREGEALDLGARGVQPDEAVSQLLCRRLGARLGLCPVRAAEPVQPHALGVARADIFGDEVERCRRDIEKIRSGEGDLNEITLGTVHRHALHADKATDAVVLVHDEVAGRQVGERLDAVAVRALDLGLFAACEHLPLSHDHQTEVGVLETGGQRALHDVDAAALREKVAQLHIEAAVGQRVEHIFTAQRAAADDRDRASLLGIAADVGGRHVQIAAVGIHLVGDEIFEMLRRKLGLMQSGLFTEIVLIDADKNKAEGEAMDISHGIPFASPMKIYAGDYDDVADAAIVVISAGAGQKPGETRLDLVNKNVAIFKSIIPEIAKRNFAGIMLVVANPVDILTQVAIKLSGLPENRVIGSGTVLDSARLRYKLGEHLSVDSRSVHAFIVGEHGDSEVVVWSSANVSGVPLSEMCEMRGHYKHKENTAEIATAVKNSAYEIINKKHATYYGIAMSVKRICEVIMRDEKSILPVSHMIHGVYDIDGVSLSMPAIVGADGIESDIPINLSGEEALKLKESADSLKKIIETIEL